MSAERIILCSANLTREFLDQITAEIQYIETIALRKAVVANYIRVGAHPAITYTHLSDLMTDAGGNDITMLHYAGHSSEAGLHSTQGQQEIVLSPAELAGLSRIHRRLRFVFLNSCCSEEIAKALIDSGVHFVIGTTRRIGDKKGAIVAGKFYQHLSSQGKTIREAYDLTKSYFLSDSYQEDPELKDAFRELGTGSGSTGNFPWQIYEHPDLGWKEREWCMIPKKQRHCLLQTEQKRLKVFCIHEKDPESTDVYEALAAEFKTDPKTLLHSIQAISPDDIPTAEDVINECGSAEVIIHLLTDSSYKKYWESLPSEVTDLCKSKPNIFIAIKKEYRVAAATLAVHKIAAFTTLPKKQFTWESIQDYREMPVNSSLTYICEQTSIFDDLRKAFNDISNKIQVDPKLLEQSIYKFDFANELHDCRIAATQEWEKLLFFILIEGTAKCAQALLYKRLRVEVNLKSNVHKIRISFSSPEGNIITIKDFYRSLLKQLNMFAPPAFEEASICIPMFLQPLQHNDMVLFFDDFGSGDKEMIDARMKIIVEFWNDLKTHLPPDMSINRLFIFAINLSHPDISFDKLTLTRNDKFQFDRVVIKRLTKNEFKRWHGLVKKQIVAQKFEDMYYATYNNIETYRAESLGIICTPLVDDTNKDIILNNILDYDKYPEEI